MRRLRSILPFVLLALALPASGCSGQQVAADEVPGAPPAIAVPEAERGGSEVLAGGNAASSTDSQAEDTGTTAAEGAASATPQGQDTGAATGTDGAAAGGTPGAQPTAPAQAETPQADQAPSQGSEAQRFEDFCQQNAGAC